MSELDETILESVENSKESPLNSKIAIVVALTATFMALCNIKGGNIVQNMAKAQSKSVNYWSYFQAKSTKQNLVENSILLLNSQMINSDEKSQIEIKKSIEQLTKKVEKYEQEKEVIKKDALNEEKSYDDMNVFDDQFDMTEAFLSISVALFGLSALTQKKQLFAFALCISLVGIIFGVCAFLKIPLHSDFISNLLG